jgi:hypothetical protein
VPQLTALAQTLGNVSFYQAGASGCMGFVRTAVYRLKINSSMRFRMLSMRSVKSRASRSTLRSARRVSRSMRALPSSGVSQFAKRRASIASRE